jgi:hypothetical protein
MNAVRRLILLAFTAYSAEPKIILGVLEEIPGHSADQSASRGVRVLFKKDGRDWKPFPSSCDDEACLKAIASKYPSAMTWTITFSGRNLGQVTAATPKTFEFFSDIGVQQITSKGPAPAVGKRSAEFGGFLQSPVLRPLVAASQPNFKDPELWKPSNPSAAVAALLRQEFRKQFPKVMNCTQDGGNEKPWPYRDADIKLTKVYSSQRNWSVVQITLERDHCDGPPGDPFVGQWFAITPGGKSIFIGAGMWLVDAGDYDNDGASELVFAINRYDQGGYELFYDDFKGHAVFQFSYH